MHAMPHASYFVMGLGYHLPPPPPPKRGPSNWGPLRGIYVLKLLTIAILDIIHAIATNTLDQY